MHRQRRQNRRLDRRSRARRFSVRGSSTAMKAMIGAKDRKRREDPIAEVTAASEEEWAADAGDMETGRRPAAHNFRTAEFSHCGLVLKTTSTQ